MLEVTIAPEKGDLITKDIASYDTTSLITTDPTARLHLAFVGAFKFFNDHLFESRAFRSALSHCEPIAAI
jgi:hypothetical protein